MVEALNVENAALVGHLQFGQMEALGSGSNQFGFYRIGACKATPLVATQLT